MMSCHITKAGITRPAHGICSNRVTCTRDEGSGYQKWYQPGSRNVGPREHDILSNVRLYLTRTPVAAPVETWGR